MLQTIEVPAEGVILRCRPNRRGEARFVAVTPNGAYCSHFSEMRAGEWLSDEIASEVEADAERAARAARVNPL